MAVTVNSDLGQGLVRENWQALYVTPFYERNKVLPFMLNKTADVKKGDIVNIPVQTAALSVGTVNASTAALNIQTPTITNVQLSVNSPRDVSVDLHGVSREQAESEFESNFPGQAGEALSEEMEAAALALYSAATGTAVGSSGGSIGEDELLAAIQAAVTAKLPIMKSPGEFCFALADNAFAPLRKLNIFDHAKTGVAGESAAKDLNLESYGGVPVRFSTQVALNNGDRKSMLFHKSAFAWAAQKNPEYALVDRKAAAQWSYLMTCIGLYGVKEVATARAFVITHKA